MAITTSKTGQRNDEIRQKALFGPGQPSDLKITPGVHDLGAAALGHLVLEFMAYTVFDPQDDLRGDRDFGALDCDGTTVWFRIEPKEGEPENRVITFHLPDEA